MGAEYIDYPNTLESTAELRRELIDPDFIIRFQLVTKDGIALKGAQLFIEIRVSAHRSRILDIPMGIQRGRNLPTCV